MSYEGSCHCGKVTFTVASDVPTQGMSCNCSHCRRKGFLWSFVPRDVFSLSSGEDHLKTYLFNKHVIEHRFCDACGCEPFGLGTMADGSKVAAINLRCVPSIDLDALTIQAVDGASR